MIQLSSKSKYNIPLKAPPELVCMKKQHLGMSQDKYSTWLRLELYLFLNTLPCAVFSVHTCRSVLSNTYIPNWVHM